jgi:3-phosphoglycerate kinase
MNTTWREHTAPDLRTLKGKRVLVRVDWNVPLNDYREIADLSRYNVTVPFEIILEPNKLEIPIVDIPKSKS